jgi:ribosomal protein S18 acetylase RimI-like enzyme
MHRLWPPRVQQTTGIGEIVNSTPDPVVRPATPDDHRALGRLGALLVEVHHQFDPRRFFAADADTARGYGDFLVSQIGRQQAVLLVVERDGEVLGYSYSGIEGADFMALRGPAGVLYDLIVDPAGRGQGLGSILLGAMIDALSTRGVPQIVLFAAHQNAAAQQLFARNGFRPAMVEMTREVG